MHWLFGSNYSYHRHLWRIICYLLVTPKHINSSCAAEFICCCTRKHFHRRATKYRGCRYHLTEVFPRHECLKWKSGSVSFIKERYKHTYCISCEWTPLITHMNTVHRVQDLSCTCNTLILSLFQFCAEFLRGVLHKYSYNFECKLRIHEGKESTSPRCSACNVFFIPIANVACN